MSFEQLMSDPTIRKYIEHPNGDHTQRAMIAVYDKMKVKETIKVDDVFTFVNRFHMSKLVFTFWALAFNINLDEGDCNTVVHADSFSELVTLFSDFMPDLTKDEFLKIVGDKIGPRAVMCIEHKV